jgi:hypothetical protein
MLPSELHLHEWVSSHFEDVGVVAAYQKANYDKRMEICDHGRQFGKPWRGWEEIASAA